MSVPQEMAYYLPAKYRKWVYTALFVVGLALGATTAGFVAVAAALPTWLIAAQAVYGYLATASQFVARANMAPESHEDAA